MSRLTIAIPSKGRLKDQAEAWLSACGFRLRQIGGERGYQAELSGLPDTDVLLLSAREIAEGLLSGRLHVGVTGEDLLHDLSSDLDAQAHIIRKLGFGKADMVVAVPGAWVDVSTMADLDAAGARFRARHGRRLRVATKYLASTRRFFAARSVGEYRLVESAGATEAAPNSGTADLIVDITTTGATLKANGLKILEDGLILKSQAALVASLGADWSASARAAIARLMASVEARAEAERLVKLTAYGAIPNDTAINLGLLDFRESVAFCPRNTAAYAAEQLCRAGLGPVSVESVDFLFRAETDALQQLLKKI
ncbi:MAG: ATP phosphoribosyltransferase [Hyphomonadaceae bacterium]|nr:ATP phosphoribosyltransferase [Hyphomonadaceae bacterium]